ncbi:hypothetical protein ACFR95_11690, partial [Halolamina salifodinae]
MTQPTPISRVRVRGGTPDPDLGRLEAVESDAEAEAVVAVGAATVDRFYEVTNLPEPDGGAFAR